MLRIVLPPFVVLRNNGLRRDAPKSIMHENPSIGVRVGVVVVEPLAGSAQHHRHERLMWDFIPANLINIIKVDY